ncbi:MAG: gliding motility-associated C-terminal domain-containing protein [Bacteroidota bacterium]
MATCFGVFKGIFLSFFSCILFFPGIYGQGCPPNIDFEAGNFSNWTCHTGTTAAVNNQNIISVAPSGPMAGRHTMYTPGDAGVRDYFGNFPVLCPNGSGYSVKLGNDRGGTEAEGISYDFTIPAGRTTYSLIYHYAVVFQDPRHLDFQQPRLVLEVRDMTDNVLINCSSFTFFPIGSSLPGFFLSPLSADSTDVWCKDWSAVTINLNNMAGKNIRLFFKTADCTFRRHFGYAYIDVNTECSSEFTGATYCPDDTAVVVTAPYGYQSYNWFDTTFTQLLGTGQILQLSPPPPSGTMLAVELIPYNGYGCQDTLYARMVDTLTLKANAGLDVTSCNLAPVQIGANAKPGVVYSWTPAAGLTNAAAANPRASPAVTTGYELTVRSLGGGCVNRDSVIVAASVIDSSLQLLGKNLFCVTSSDSAVLLVQPTDSIQWFLNNSAIAGANQPRYRAGQSGTYMARMFTDLGCSLSTRTEQIVIETPRLPVVYPLQYAIINFPVQLQARPFGSTYLWNPVTWLDDASSPNPFFNSPVIEEKTYTVDITTAAGCLTVDTQLVKTLKEVKIYVPTAFTPNNDGRNDYLRPIMLGVKQLQYFRVYNRWGQVVYNMQPNQRGWDGNVKGQVQNTAVYVWTMEALGYDNRKYFQKGTVLLMK